jgi:hypothetical protein
MLIENSKPTNERSPTIEGITFHGFSCIIVTKNGFSWSHSYSMKWYSYSKAASETDPVNVPAANVLKGFGNSVRRQSIQKIEYEEEYEYRDAEYEKARNQ